MHTGTWHKLNQRCLLHSQSCHVCVGIQKKEEHAHTHSVPTPTPSITHTHTHPTPIPLSLSHTHTHTECHSSPTPSPLQHTHTHTHTHVWHRRQERCLLHPLTNKLVVSRLKEEQRSRQAQSCGFCYVAILSVQPLRKKLNGGCSSVDGVLWCRCCSCAAVDSTPASLPYIHHQPAWLALPV